MQPGSVPDPQTLTKTAADAISVSRNLRVEVGRESLAPKLSTPNPNSSETLHGCKVFGCQVSAIRLQREFLAISPGQSVLPCFTKSGK